MAHTSVLLQEAVDSLNLAPGAVVVDATFGGGGHSRLIAECIGKTGRLIAFDQDKEVFTERTVDEIGQQTEFLPVVDNFRNIDKRLSELGVSSIDGAIFDLGLSSTQLEASGRGFSFQRDEPLLMTFASDPSESDVTAERVVNEWSEETLILILSSFGEESFARRIAKAIVSARGDQRIVSTRRLAEIVNAAVPGWYTHRKTNPATKTFQAIRMAVNDELGAIEHGITDAISRLASEGRIAVISFHSVEDRAVKQLLLKLAKNDQIALVNKKPIVPSEAELQDNPRARSAKLRVAQKQ